MSKMTSVLGIAALTVCIGYADDAQSAENGLTNYLPGYYSDFAVAVTPATGLYTYATVYSYSATSVGPAGPDGLALDGLLTIGGFQYVTSQSLFGGRYGFGGYTTWVNADLSLGPSTFSTNGHGDSSLSPLILYWSAGDVYVSFYEAIIVPTGQFSLADVLNTSRNYVSFDTVLATTWLDPKAGFEISLVGGVIANTENPDSHVRTGTEIHIDSMANVFLSQQLALGVHGYLYAQIEGDTGTGLRSTSAGIGPAIMIRPDGFNGKFVGKWLHEFDGQNRFLGDIVSLTTAFAF